MPQIIKNRDFVLLLSLFFADHHGAIGQLHVRAKEFISG